MEHRTCVGKLWEQVRACLRNKMLWIRESQLAYYRRYTGVHSFDLQRTMCYETPVSPAVTKTMSAPLKTFRISDRLSMAAAWPTSGLPPAPNPRVTSDPSATFTCTVNRNTNEVLIDFGCKSGSLKGIHSASTITLLSKRQSKYSLRAEVHATATCRLLGWTTAHSCRPSTTPTLPATHRRKGACSMVRLLQANTPEQEK